MEALHVLAPGAGAGRTRAGSIERTADWLAFVTERLRRLCALQSYRLIWDSPVLGRKTNLTWSFVGCEDAGF